MAKQFTLEERLRDGSHVDGKERLAPLSRALRLGSAGETVDLGGQHLLARSVLARDEDVGIGGRYLFHHHTQVAHDWRFAPVHGALGRMSVGWRGGRAVLWCLDLTALGQTGQQGADKFLVVEGLHNEVVGPFLHATHGQLDVSVGGEEHDLRVGTEALDLVQPEDALVAGVDATLEVHVEQHHVGLVLAKAGGNADRARQRHHTLKHARQKHAHGGQDVAVVVYDK